MTVNTDSVLALRREREAERRRRKTESGLCRSSGCVNPRAVGAVSCEACLERDRDRSRAATTANEFQNGAAEFWAARAEGRDPLNPFPRESPEYRDYANGLREAKHASEIMERADIRQETDADGNVRNTYRKKPRAGGRPRKRSKR